jgi:hypothetical protein
MKRLLLGSLATLALVGWVSMANAQDRRSDRDAETGLGIAGAVLGFGDRGYRERDDGDRYEQRRYRQRRHHDDEEDD